MPFELTGSIVRDGITTDGPEPVMPWANPDSQTGSRGPKNQLVSPRQ